MRSPFMDDESLPSYIWGPHIEPSVHAPPGEVDVPASACNGWNYFYDGPVNGQVHRTTPQAHDVGVHSAAIQRHNVQSHRPLQCMPASPESWHVPVPTRLLDPNPRNRSIKPSSSHSSRSSVGVPKEMQELVDTFPLPWPEARTTVMVRNIPFHYTQEMLLSEFPCRESFDFLYLPQSVSSARNLSYAFINFRTEELALQFQQTWNQTRLAHFASRKPLNVIFSSIQGRDACLWVLNQNQARDRRKTGKRSQPFIVFGSTEVSIEAAISDLDGRIVAFQSSMLGGCHL